MICAGRTDTGVHASAQVVHFDTSSERSSRGWLLGANSNLPDDINVIWAQPVDDSFHARFSATSRSYEYLHPESTGTLSPVPSSRLVGV